MPCIVTSAEVDEAIRTVLVREGFSISASKFNGENGVDLLATDGNTTWHIETIAYKSGGAQRSMDFRTGFFRAVSRLKDGATKLALAVPASFGDGLHQRAAQYGEAWRRFGLAFPELEIWIVDCGSPTITRTRWNSWLTKGANSAPADSFSDAQLSVRVNT